MARLPHESGNPDPTPPHRVSARAGLFAMWLVWSAATLILASALWRLPVAHPDGWGPDLMRIAPPLARWDSGWYYGVAVSGYRYDPGNLQNSVGFYPLYPLIVRAAAGLLHAPVFETGIAVSLACLLGALLLLAPLGRAWGRPGDVLPAGAALLLFPSAFFFAAFYTESLFLLATAAALWAARRERWLLAGIAGAAACLTRLNGFLIAVPILVLLWESRGQGARKGERAAGLACLALGAAAYPAYLWRRWGDPLLYLHDKARGWPGYAFGEFWRSLGRLAFQLLRIVRDPAAAGKLVFVLEAGSLLFAAAATVFLFRQRLVPEALYVGATVALLVLSGSLDSFQRYAVVLFPAFLLPARLMRRSPAFAFAYAVAGWGLSLLSMARFVHWIFVG